MLMTQEVRDAWHPASCAEEVLCRVLASSSCVQEAASLPAASHFEMSLKKGFSPTS